MEGEIHLLVEKKSSNHYEKKYHFLIDNILDVVGELDLNGIFTYVNHYIYDELGYQPDEIIGREIYEFVHPDDAKKITKVLFRRPKSHDSIPEIRLKNDKNQFIWYEIKARRIKDYNNQRKILITLKNISKVKVLEERLEKEEENYQKITNSFPEIQFWKIFTPSKYERATRTTSEMLKVIVENIPQCVFWKDTNFKYLGCNGNYSEFIGIEHPESIIGKTDEDLLSNREKIQQIRESETSVMLSCKPSYHTNESWIIEKGENIRLDINRVPLIDTKGDVNGILVTFEEITDRKIAEEKLRNSEKKYKNLSIELETIMDIIPSMIFVKNKSGIYTRVNQVFADYLKLEKEDIIGKSTFDLFPQEFATNLKRDDLEVIKNGIPKLNIEETVEFPEGKVSGIISKMPYYDEKDEINGVIGFAIDISEHKELEQRLIKSEERYRELANLLHQVICETDERGNLTFVNNNAYRVFGYTPDDFDKGLNALQMLIPEDREHAMENIKRVLSGKNVEKMGSNEYIALRKDGRTFPVIIYSSPVIYKDTSVGMRSLIIDITEQKKAEQKLKESEEKFRTITEQSLVGICIAQGNKIKYINQVYADIFGYTIEEMMNWELKDVVIAIHPEDREFCLEQLAKKQRGDKDIFKHYQYRGIKKSGEIKWVDNYSKSFEYEGKPADFITIIDITEKKEVEQGLKESEEKYRNLIETSSMCLMEIDVSKGGVVYINPRFVELTGYTQEELLSKEIFHKAIYPDDYKKITKSDEDKNIELRIINKEGKTIWLSGRTLHHYGDQGNLITLRLWLQDITEIKEIEEMKANLLTRFSHEFKTPLISIKGFADFLLTEYKVNLNEKILSFLRRIKEGSDRLDALINSFIESSQLEKAVIRMSLRQEDVSNLIQEILNDLEGFIGMREHTINVSLDQKLITTIDKEKIYTVLSNILINAIDYTPQGGKISIKSSIDKKFLTISVKDNGIGLTEEEKNRLFKPFGKIERFGKGWDITIGGMGMGLYISKEIIELHGGKIWAESEGRNKGSEFHFSLPIK